MVTQMDKEEFKKKLKKVTIGAHNCSVTGVHLIYTKDEWKARAEKLFGKDEFKWQFKCPSCGNIQTPDDFRKIKNAMENLEGLAVETRFNNRLPTVEDTYYNCIGRFTGTRNEIFSKEKPCNYTLGGLMHLSHTVVKDDAGRDVIRARKCYNIYQDKFMSYDGCENESPR